MPNFVHETPRFTPIRFTLAPGSSGANTVVAAVTSLKIRVLSLWMSPASAVNAKWQSSTTSDITKLFYMPSAGVGVTLPHNPMGWFQTVAGELLNLDLSGAVVVNVGGVYIAV